LEPLGPVAPALPGLVRVTPAARGQHHRVVGLLQRLGAAAADFTVANVDEDTPNDLLADKSRLFIF
jgi:hypothetical protein